jgi:hypothetical protein
MGKAGAFLRTMLADKNGESHPFGIKDMNFDMPGEVGKRLGESLKMADPGRITPTGAIKTASIASVKGMQAIVIGEKYKAQLKLGKAYNDILNHQEQFLVGKSNLNLQRTTHSAKTAEALSVNSFKTNLMGEPAQASVSWMEGIKHKALSVIE